MVRRENLMKNATKPEWLKPCAPLRLVFMPGITPEQHAKALEVVGDLFELAGGRGGLRIVQSEAVRVESKR